MQAGKLFLVYFLFSSLCLTSQAQDAPAPYSALNGNWNLAGGRNSAGKKLFLSLSIGVSGDSVYGSGFVDVNCSEKGRSHGSSIFLIGQMAPDRTFQLTNSARPDVRIQVSIQGTAPSDGETTWEGSFTITNSVRLTECTIDLSNDFVASAYPPLNGTYVGMINGHGLGPGITISAQITQDAFSFSSLTSSNPTFFALLSSTISVSGSPCFTKGTSTQGNATDLITKSLIRGDEIDLRYSMNDGSTLLVVAWLTDLSESALKINMARVDGGKCDGAIAMDSGTLTRQ
jgi:hypothetical protein